MRATPMLTAMIALVPVPTSGQIFTPVEQTTGLDVRHFNGMTGELYLPEITGAGLAFLDYDLDGDLDLYVVQGQLLGPETTLEDAVLPPPSTLPLSDRLLRNDTYRTGGTVRTEFVDVTGVAGFAAQGYGMGVATGDIDGDGAPDLYLTNLGPNQLWVNQGDGTFLDRTEAAGVDDVRWSTTATFFDADGDGSLDLFVGNYVDFTYVRHRKCATVSGAPDYCGPAAYQGEPDRLFRNQGDGTFADVSGPSGLGASPAPALGAVAVDFDRDGDVDLYVANDQMPNFLWTNRGDGTFVDDALLAGAAVNREGQAEASMGVDAADLDADGDDDLFMAHLKGETNTLYANDGRGLFTDVTTQAELGKTSWEHTAFGTAFLDLDGDGWLDLATANGAVKTIEAQARDREPLPLAEPNQLFRNTGTGRFEEITDQGGDGLAESAVSRGLAVGDFDNDGATDLAWSNNAGPVRLLRNDVAAATGWVGVTTLGPTANWLGARGALTRSDGVVVHRRARTDGSYASAHDHRLQFGLDGHRPEALELTWPDGRTVRWASPAVGRWARWP